MEKLKANMESFRKAARKAAKRIIKNNRDLADVAYIHPSLINDYNHKCYTWEQLWLKIQHNRNAKKLREVFNIK